MTREQFITLTEQHQTAVRRYLVALCCGDSQQADDLAQEALIKAYLAMDNLDDPQKFKPWVYRIACNTFLDSRRSVRHTTGVEDAASLSSPETSDSAFRYQALYRALQLIPDKERLSILLFYMEGYSVKEISEITGASQEAVRQQLSRGRKHLKEILE